MADEEFLPVMAIISNLITTYHTDSLPVPSVTLRIAEWVTSMVNVLGLNGTAGPDDKTIGWSGIDIPKESRPVLIALSRKRDTLRQKVRIIKVTYSITNYEALHSLKYPIYTSLMDLSSLCIGLLTSNHYRPIPGYCRGKTSNLSPILDVREMEVR